VFVRWNGQLVEVESQGRLPGVSGGVVRTFDAPEALETRFHEVHTKSALNRVPGGSRVPFDWTVNPYRGCAHACTYCSDPDTPILMGDGSVRRIADLRVGDEIYGTRVEGRHRRYTRTTVLDHWSVIKPAHRVMLSDGTELVSSGDHRYLSERGWKFVAGAMHGAARRPYLTTSDALLGTGGFAAAPAESAEYRRGYVTGMVRGDGSLARCAARRTNDSTDVAHRFRLALTDVDALDRTERYLALDGVRTDRFVFAVAAGGRRAIAAIHSQSGRVVSAIEDLVRYPLSPGDDWLKGFLAGIFDAQGSCSQGVLRISNADPQILGWTQSALGRFGFDAVLDRPRENGVRNLRVRGGLRERLRFFLLTDPAVARKRDIDGVALKSDADLRVVAIEPLPGARRLFDMTTGTGDFIANGVVSHNCFARPTHEYLELGAGRDFEKEIVVKVNVPEVLRAELARPSWRGEHVALGTNTDPYQWVEGRYKLMRGIWAALRDARNPCSILTKSPLLLRDLDLLLEVAEVTTVSACLSVPTLDEKAWRATEPGTPHPRKRLEAVAALNAAGIPTGILISPLMPGINDAPEQVDEIIRLATEAGAVSIGGATLFLRGAVREIFFDWLRTQRPDLVPRYEQLYARGAYAPRAERERIERRVRIGRLRDFPKRFQRGFAPGLDDPKRAAYGPEGARGAPEEARREPVPPPPVQEALF
jgi:DNA repair photolyase